MNITNDITPAEAKKFAQAMIDADMRVELACSQEQKGDKTVTSIRITQPGTGRKLGFYAEAAPDCYSDLSQIPTSTSGQFTLKQARIGQTGISILLEDEDNGRAFRLRVIVARSSTCVNIISYHVAHDQSLLETVV